MNRTDGYGCPTAPSDCLANDGVRLDVLKPAPPPAGLRILETRPGEVGNRLAGRNAGGSKKMQSYSRVESEKWCPIPSRKRPMKTRAEVGDMVGAARQYGMEYRMEKLALYLTPKGENDDW